MFIRNNMTTAGTNLIRMILYIPKDPQGFLPNVGFYSPLDKDQYTILQDRYMTLGSGTSANDNDPSVKVVNLRRRLGMHVRYSGDLSTTVTKNPLYLYFASSSPDGALLDGYIYAYYTDT